MADSTLEARLAAVEAELAIRNLASRYAIAVDTRDIDLLASLYAPTLQVAPEWGEGAAGEAARIAAALRTFYRTFHQIAGQVVELTGPQSASGLVYCKAEHEFGDEWLAMAICYTDQYVLHEGRWLFAAQRQIRKVYNADMAKGPVGPYSQRPGATEPDPRITWGVSTPSWSAFWDKVPDDQRRKVTRFP